MTHKTYIFIFGFALMLFACVENKKQPVTYDDYKLKVVEKINYLAEKTKGIKLYNQQVFWGHDSLNLALLSEVAENKLFFCFSDQTCTPCINTVVDLISQYFPDYLNSDSTIVFISPDYPVRFRENCYGKKLLGLKIGKIGIPLEEENVPFFLVLNKNVEIVDVHIVNKNDFDKTAKYLNNYATQKNKQL